MALTLRDRIFTRQTAEAMLSPAAILLVGAGLAVGVLAGSILGGVVLAAALWVGRVAMGMPRNERAPAIDPFSLQEPWRRFVQEAQQAQARFAQAVATTRPGPLRDRLAEIGGRIDAGVHECWNVASRGHVLAGARKQIDTAAIEAELASARANLDAPWAAGAGLDEQVTALESQLASAQRMDTVITDAGTRLQVLDARLDEAVTRAIELSVQATDTVELGGLGSDVESMVEEMEALRLALEETSGRPLPGSGGSAGSADAPGS